MNKLEQFIAIYEPESDVVFRQMLEQVVQEIKNKSQPTNEAIGMRDYFAAKAMQAYLTTTRRKNIDEGYVVADEQYAAWSYEMADAMMEARND